MITLARRHLTFDETGRDAPARLAYVISDRPRDATRTTDTPFPRHAARF
jgi:hypothetical protein